MSTRKADWVRFGALGVVVFAIGFGLPRLWLVWQASHDRVGVEPSGEVRALAYAWALLPWLIGAALLALAITRKRWIPFVAFTAAQGLGLVLVVTWMFTGPVIADYASRIAFDTEKWKAENRSEPQGVRVRMVDDLLRRHKLVGMTREQVDELLGVPPHTNYFGEYDYVYWLGPERGFFSIDSEWLAIKFERGVVVAARVLTD